MNKLYQEVTDKIVQFIESNQCLPWEKPWNSLTPPSNYMTRNPYHGINLLLTSLAPFTHQYWLTFNQCRSLGGKVKKGEKSTPIIYFSRKQFEEDGEDKSFSFLKKYSIFNIEQTDLNIPKEEVKELGEFESIKACENIVDGYKDGPSISHDTSIAYFDPKLDVIRLPSKGSFKSNLGYYSTLFHEFGHSSGSIFRLARDGVTKPTKFKSILYSKEEIIAELCSSFLSASVGVTIDKEIKSSADYINSYISAFKNDPKLIVQASAQAQKACNYILGIKAKYQNNSNQAIA